MQSWVINALQALNRKTNAGAKESERMSVLMQKQLNENRKLHWKKMKRKKKKQ